MQDLFYTDVGNQVSGAASVNVLPGSTTTIYGQPVTADTPKVLFSGLTDSSGVAIDPAGDLYVDYYGNVGVVSPTSGTFDGTSVTANTLSQLATGLLGDLGNTLYDGNLFVVDQDNGSIDELTTPTAAVASVTFGGSPSNPLIMVQGNGFNTAPPTSPTCGSSTGQDYKYGNLFLIDNTNAWGAGIPGDCVGLTVAKLKTGTTEFGLGSSYVKDGDALAAGDSYTLGVDGTTVQGDRELRRLLPRHHLVRDARVRTDERGNLGDHQGHRPDGDHVGVLRMPSRPSTSRCSPTGPSPARRHRVSAWYP